MPNDEKKVLLDVQSVAPNMRFGTSFLDLKYHKTMHAVNDEALMDKRTGQIVYKRNTDGKLIYYAQENIHLNNYMRQLQTLIRRNRKTYIRPTFSNYEKCDSVYFLSYNIDTIDFEFDPLYADKLVLGGSLVNPHAAEHSMIQETNGIFIQLNGRPRDRAALSFLTSLYDDYYMNYEGTDVNELAKKSMYEVFGFEDSNAAVNYTVSYYDSLGRLYAQNTSNAYVRVNELSYVPFTYPGIYPRDIVDYATLRINSISLPKIGGVAAADLITTPNKEKAYEALLDNGDFEFISINVSYFLTTEDQKFTMPTEENTVPLLAMGWTEFQRELERAREGAGADGVIIDVLEPDVTDWEYAAIWVELLRFVLEDGTEIETEHENDLDALEKQFGKISYYKTIFTTDKEDLKNIWVELETESEP